MEQDEYNVPDNVFKKPNDNDAPVEESNALKPKVNVTHENKLLQPDSLIQESISPDLPLQTTPMEIHHAGHIHTDKKWKEYLFQFLMLFLAVFCGFFAEYWLEHIMEHQREKQFMESLVKDIDADIARLHTIITLRNSRENRLDSLSLIMNSAVPVVPTSMVYTYAVTPARSLLFRFIPNDGTIQQLKNSGAFRLIRNRTVADSIGRYDVSLRSFLRQGEIEEVLIQDYRVASAPLFNALVFDRIIDEDNNVKAMTENPPLLNYTKRDLEIWNYKMYSMKALNKANRRDAKLLLQQAINLYQTIKKEYQL